MQSNLTPSLALTINPLFGMSPVDTLVAGRITCNPAPAYSDTNLSNQLK